jgi:hypothetical protein
MAPGGNQRVLWHAATSRSCSTAWRTSPASGGKHGIHVCCGERNRAAVLWVRRSDTVFFTFPHWFIIMFFETVIVLSYSCRIQISSIIRTSAIRWNFGTRLSDKRCNEQSCGNFVECSLFYAFVKIGTPGKQYLVALDTGTDLLWLPCECQHCSPLSVSSDVDPRTVSYPLPAVNDGD